MINGTHRKPTRYSITDAGDAIRRREVFVAGDGSLTGGHADDTGSGAGRLSGKPLQAFLSTYVRTDGPLYVVRSYGTPIAWAGPGELLTVPAVRYSVTMSRHQSIARRADYPGGICAGLSPHGHGDPRCGRKGGHTGYCDWSD